MYCPSAPVAFIREPTGLFDETIVPLGIELHDRRLKNCLPSHHLCSVQLFLRRPFLVPCGRKNASDIVFLEVMLSHIQSGSHDSICIVLVAILEGVIKEPRGAGGLDCHWFVRGGVFSSEFAFVNFSPFGLLASKRAATTIKGLAAGRRDNGLGLAVISVGRGGV